MDAMNETMRSMRESVRRALTGRTVTNAAFLAECSENTIQRILRGENVMIHTVARIASRLGSGSLFRSKINPNSIRSRSQRQIRLWFPKHALVV
jgi:hypothetical protein